MAVTKAQQWSLSTRSWSSLPRPYQSRISMPRPRVREDIVTPVRSHRQPTVATHLLDSLQENFWSSTNLLEESQPKRRLYKPWSRLHRETRRHLWLSARLRKQRARQLLKRKEMDRQPQPSTCKLSAQVRSISWTRCSSKPPTTPYSATHCLPTVR